ncbi:MAG: glycosyltransferase family 4 protein [Anaerolineales bacterium]|nr:glycosyltransferase family 4 protein [Anaerolineales bacterium]
MSAFPHIIVARSNPIAPDPRVEKATAALAEAGYHVTIIGWDRSAALPPREIISGIDCIRLPIQAQFGHGLGNFAPLLRWQWGLLRWLMQNRRGYNIIHACDFDTVLPALVVKLLFGKRVVYDIFDFYTDHLRATPGWVKSLIRSVDLWAIRRVDALIITDESRWVQVGERLPQNRAVVLNTPRDYDYNTLTRTSQTQMKFLKLRRRKERQEEQKRKTWRSSPIRGDFSAKKTLNLVYVGLLQTERGLLNVLNVLGDHPEWHLDLAGFGGDENQILALSDELPNVTWHGRIPYERALALTAAADVVLALYDPAIPNHRYASPNKLFEAMMLGKPVIVAADTNIDRIVQAENCGLVVEYGHRPELVKALECLQLDKVLYAEFAANARRAYEQDYDWSTVSARLLRLYQQLR